MTHYAETRKRSTYARLLKPGQKFFGGTSSYPTIHTVDRIEPDHPGSLIRVLTSTGSVLYYNDTERVKLA